MEGKTLTQADHGAILAGCGPGERFADILEQRPPFPANDALEDGLRDRIDHGRTSAV